MNQYQQSGKKFLKKVEFHGIGSYHEHHARCVTNGAQTVFKGDDQSTFNNMKNFFSSGIEKNVQVVAVVIITECQQGDPAIGIIGRTALRDLSVVFPDKNVLVGMATNPYTTREASNAPLKCAEALFNGWTMFYCSQSNVLGAASKRAIFSLTVNLDATGKNYMQGNNQSQHTNTSYPASIMFNIQDDQNGQRLVGSSLTQALLAPFAGKNGYVTASVYGIAQKPSSYDSQNEVIPQKPSISFSYHDDVRVSGSGDFRCFDKNYHGLLMAYPFIGNSNLESSNNGIVFSQNSSVSRALKDAFNEIALPDVFTLNLGILTTNKKKVIEIKNILEKVFSRTNMQFGGSLSRFKILVDQIKFSSMIEEQILDPVECVESKMEKCRLNAQQLQAVLGRSAIFIDDTSFAVEALDMQPGTFYKQHYEKGEIDARNGKGIKYNNFICQMVNAYVQRETQNSMSCGPTDNKIRELRCAYATTIFVTVLSSPWGTTFECVFRSTVNGIISETPLANDLSKEFGWDPIFIPNIMESPATPGQFVQGSGKTYQQMGDDEIALSKPRGFALKKMLQEIILLLRGMTSPAEEYDFGLDKKEQQQSIENMNNAIAVTNNLIANNRLVVTNNSNTAVNQAGLAPASQTSGGVSINDIFASFQ